MGIDGEVIRAITCGKSVDSLWIAYICYMELTCSHRS